MSHVNDISHTTVEIKDQMKYSKIKQCLKMNNQ